MKSSSPLLMKIVTYPLYVTHSRHEGAIATIQVAHASGPAAHETAQANNAAAQAACFHQEHPCTPIFPLAIEFGNLKSDICPVFAAIAIA
jgi:hypothetical protein